MARSEDAIRRRALKRQRTEEQQRDADRKDMEQSKARKIRGTQPHNSTPSRDISRDERMKEFGAWKCRQCGNENFASRNWCNSKTCNEPRPHNLPGQSASYRKSIKAPRHDPETSKKLIWAKQADSKTVSKNQDLRRRYQESGGEGMSAEEIERAKTLLARDERKRQKKQEKLKTQDCEIPAVESKTEEVKAEKTGGKEVASSKAQRDKNQALLQRYQETKGVGMTHDQVKRAQTLLARAQRKRRKRVQ